MIFLCNAVPSFCPDCGHRLQFIGLGRKVRAAIKEFMDDESQICSSCGSRFQRVETYRLLASAEFQGGDLREKAGDNYRLAGEGALAEKP